MLPTTKGSQNNEKDYINFMELLEKKKNEDVTYDKCVAMTGCKGQFKFMNYEL